MVYNALKLFMEINPEMFEEAQNNYKIQRRE
jgi:serine/threonine-protein phosphatase 2A regulatory subunit B'